MAAGMTIKGKFYKCKLRPFRVKSNCCLYFTQFNL